MIKPLLLVVEDEPVSRELLVGALQESGYALKVATTGEDAWRIIAAERSRIDAILLDRLLPDMDALALLPRLKADPGLAHVPVIMQTSLAGESEVEEGLRAGAYYYLTKPFPPETLLAIVRSAVQDHRDYVLLQQGLRQTRHILTHLERAEFWFRTQDDARDLATLSAHVAPDPTRVVLGLTELMLNAVEHGNLGITYDEKTRLLAENALEAEVERRLALPEYAGRRARLKIDRDADAVRFTVRDQGLGFDWSPYIDLSPARAFDTHGRGIAMSRLLSFDTLEYRKAGNEVVGSVTLTAPPSRGD
ncbi:MAG: response regulator [Pseudomonadota bacterium]